MTLKCISCNTVLVSEEDFVKIKCPNCGTEIVRCKNCRRNSVPYKCPKCGFEGP